MEKKSRTEYSALNTSAALISMSLTILVGYCNRVVFTHLLSESYVGLNGLMLDVVTVLSCTELGIGPAINYALYRPVAEGNIEKQKSLIRLYRNIYWTVAAVVVFAGALLLPLMKRLLEGNADVEHLTLIYLMYLVNTALSYLFNYKRALLDVHQRTYIGVFYYSGFLILQYILQMAILVLTRDFILYLLAALLCTLSGGAALAGKADRTFPFLRDKQVQPLPAEERRGISQNIRAMLMHKMGFTIVNSTDNLLLSALVGIGSTACYSNYYLIIGSVRQVLEQMFRGIAASVGNLGVTENEKHIRKILEATFFLGQWIYGFVAICLYELLSIFVGISFGTQYVYEQSIVLILCVNFYVTGMRQAVLVFRDSMGIFWYDRYKAVVEVLINLAASILLAKSYGTAGVFIGTLISTLTTSAWVEPLVFYRLRLKASPLRYFGKYLVYTLVIFCTAFVTDYVCAGIPGSGWLLLLRRLAACIVLPNLLLLLCYHRTWEFRLLLNKGLRLLKEKFHREARY